MPKKETGDAWQDCGIGGSLVATHIAAWRARRRSPIPMLRRVDTMQAQCAAARGVSAETFRTWDAGRRNVLSSLNCDSTSGTVRVLWRAAMIAWLSQRLGRSGS